MESDVGDSALINGNALFGATKARALFEPILYSLPRSGSFFIVVGRVFCASPLFLWGLSSLLYIIIYTLSIFIAELLASSANFTYFD